MVCGRPPNFVVSLAPPDPPLPFRLLPKYHFVFFENVKYDVRLSFANDRTVYRGSVNSTMEYRVDNSNQV